jgi:hypothetical protein
VNFGSPGYTPENRGHYTHRDYFLFGNIRRDPGCNGADQKNPKNMKTKIILVSVLLSAGLVTSAFAAQGRGNSQAGRGNSSGSGSGRGTAQPSASCDQSGPGQGTPVRDGSGKANSPGKGAKDGSGNQANCPVPPTN